MSSPEEGEIDSDMSSKEGLMTVPSNNNSMLEQKSAMATSSMSEGLAVTADYRNRAGPVNSSSESGSEGEEDTPLWRQKREKYFRKNQNTTHCPSPTLPEFTPAAKNGTISDAASKKRNNVWGSVLEEQDLTQALKCDASMNRNRDFRERTVESYDFTNKYKDTRPENDPDEPEDVESESHDHFDKVLKSNTQTIQGREVIGYEDPLFGREKQINSRKRKAGFDRNESKTGVHERLGPKKVTTVKVGEWIVSEEMEQEELAKKIAEYIHEPKVELIERVAEHMGKNVAIRILNQTRDIEDGGGMLTQDGSRRRTPGGVYLQLLKQQPEYDKEMYKLIFVEDNEWKLQLKQQQRQRKRARRKSRKQQEKDVSGSRSRSASAEGRDSNQNNEDMEDDENQKPSVSESPGEKMDFEERAAEQKYRKSRSHSQSAESGEYRQSENQDQDCSKPKSRSKSFSTYSDPDEVNDDQEESSFNSSGSRKSGEFDFQKELEIAKTLITKSRSKSDKESGEMEEVEEDCAAEMNDELDEAEASVVDIPLDG